MRRMLNTVAENIAFIGQAYTEGPVAQHSPPPQQKGTFSYAHLIGTSENSAIFLSLASLDKW